MSQMSKVRRNRLIHSQTSGRKCIDVVVSGANVYMAEPVEMCHRRSEYLLRSAFPGAWSGGIREFDISTCADSLHDVGQRWTASTRAWRKAELKAAGFDLSIARKGAYIIGLQETTLSRKKNKHWESLNTVMNIEAQTRLELTRRPSAGAFLCPPFANNRPWGLQLKQQAGNLDLSIPQTVFQEGASIEGIKTEGHLWSTNRPSQDYGQYWIRKAAERLRREEKIIAKGQNWSGSCQRGKSRWQ